MPLSTVKPIADILLVCMAGLLVMSSLFSLPYARELAILAAVLATGLQFPFLTRMARIFCILAIIAFASAMVVLPHRLPEVLDALWQGVAFAALLSVLGCLRYPVRRSSQIASAAAYLVSVPMNRRYAAINVGSHFLSLLFNVGIIPLIGSMLALGKDNTEAEKLETRHLLLAGMRGTVLMTIWSPMGLGFAIVTTAIVGLDSTLFLICAFASAMGILLVTCLVMSPAMNDADSGSAGSDRRGSLGSVVAILTTSCGLLLATIVVHEFLSVSFTVATVIVLPVFSVIWVILDKGVPKQPLRARLTRLVGGIGDLRTEAAIFLSANVIGAVLSAFIREQPFWSAMQGAHYPALPVLILCLISVPLAGALFIPHSILVVLIAQLLGSSTLGVEHPVSLGLTLTLGWAMAIALSPISAMSLMTASLAGVRSHTVGLLWNLRFVTLLFGCSTTIICLAYATNA